MMKYILHSTVALVMLLMMTSCFDVVEEMTVYKDGSGKGKLVMNMSKSASQLANMMKQDSLFGQKVPSKQDMIRELDKFKAKLAAQKGISNVRSTHDFEKFVFTLQCDFSSVENMNRAAKNVFFDYDKGRTTTEVKDLATFDGKTFKRSNDLSKMPAYEDMGFMAQNVIANATYTTIYRFEQDVQSDSNRHAAVSKNHKNVFLKVMLADVFKRKISIQHSISLK